MTEAELLKQFGIKLGHGLRGKMDKVEGKRTLFVAIDLDHAELPVTEGQQKYANQHSTKPARYCARGSARLETGHFLGVQVKLPSSSGVDDASW